MKRLLIALFALVTFAASAQTTSYPFGSARELAPAYASTYSISTGNNLTFITMDSLTGNLTLNYGTIPAKTGAAVYVIVTAKTSTRAVIFGTNVEGVTDSVAANKTVMYKLIKLGTKLQFAGKFSQN